MLQSGAWPKDMEYLNCDDFQGGNTPERNIDLRQYFTQVCNNVLLAWGMKVGVQLMFTKCVKRLANQHPMALSNWSRKRGKPLTVTAI